MNPGDEVICTNHIPPCDCSLEGVMMPEIGRHYIVKASAIGNCRICKALQPAIVPAGAMMLPGHAWSANWFQPLRFDPLPPARIAETV